MSRLLHGQQMLFGLLVCIGLAFVSPASADHGGSPNIVVTPNSGLSDSGPVTVTVTGSGFPGQAGISVMQCIGLGGGGYSCATLGTPAVVVNGGFQIDIDVQWDFDPSNPNNPTCDWSDTRSCYIKAAEGDVFSGPSDTAEIVFAGHDTRTPVNTTPTCSNGSVTTNEDTAAAVALSCSDTDNDPLTYTIVTPPAHGSLSGTAPSLTYTPSANYNGPDSFMFKSNDGTEDSAPAVVSLTVSSVNDPPIASLVTSGGLSGTADGSPSYDLDGTIVSWEFVIDGDPADDTADAIEPYSFADGGTFVIQLTVTDNEGASTSTSTTIRFPEPRASGNSFDVDDRLVRTWTSGSLRWGYDYKINWRRKGVSIAGYGWTDWTGKYKQNLCTQSAFQGDVRYSRYNSTDLPISWEPIAERAGYLDGPPIVVVPQKSSIIYQHRYCVNGVKAVTFSFSTTVPVKADPTLAGELNKIIIFQRGWLNGGATGWQGASAIKGGA